jgi:hypothetical protein
MSQTMRESVRYYNAQKPGKRWYVKKNPQSQWIAGFLFVVREAGLEPECHDVKRLYFQSFSVYLASWLALASKKAAILF